MRKQRTSQYGDSIASHPSASADPGKRNRTDSIDAVQRSSSQGAGVEAPGFYPLPSPANDSETPPVQFAESLVASPSNERLHALAQGREPLGKANAFHSSM